MKLYKAVTNLCNPAKVYLVLAIVSMLMYTRGLLHMEENNQEHKETIQDYRMSGLIFKMIVSVVWVILLNYICSSGHTGIAWIVLFLPLIMFALFLLFASYFIAMMSSLPIK